MAKVINSAYLEPLNKALGLAGAGDSQTELLDGTVDQVLDVGQIARRGGTLAGTTGVFRVILRVINAGTGTVITSYQPYEPGETGLVAPYPNPVPDLFDLWLIGASIERVSGTGTLNAARLQLTNIQIGFGIDSVGVSAAASTSVITLASWDSISAAIEPRYGLSQLANPFQKIGLRIPKKGAIASPFLSFAVNVTAAAATFDGVLLIGILPAALGQDLAV